MHKIIFTEEFCQPENLHPFTLTRQIQDIRVGILTIREKWEKLVGAPSFDKWEDDYKDLDRSIRIDKKMGDHIYLMIHGNILPTTNLVKTIKQLENGQFISIKGSDGIIFRFSKKEVKEPHKIKVTKAITIKENVQSIQYPWDIFQQNDAAMRFDFELITQKRRSQPIPKSNRV